MSKIRTQPRFPCPDAPPNKLMTETDFDGEIIKTYWGNVPESDYFKEPHNWDVAEAFIEYSGAVPPGSLRKKVIRYPRCIRLITPGVTSIDTSTEDNPTIPYLKYQYFYDFAVQLKTYCETLKGFYFEWTPGDGLGEGTFTSALVKPFYPPPAAEDTLDTSFLDDNCIFGTDVLTFLILGDLDGAVYGINVDGSFIEVDTLRWDDVFVPYANAQYPKFGRYRTIILPDRNMNYVNHYFFSGDSPEIQRAIYKQRQIDFVNALPDSPIPSGFEFGPDFAFDLDYMKSTIRQHWSL